jgi:hypothetical protein
MGHVYECIEETYGRLSMQIKWKDIFLLPKMMDIYRTCEDHNPSIPYLIDEFFYFKRFVWTYWMVTTI